MMHWKVATNNSPLGVAFKQLALGLIIREADGKAIFYTYKNFPRINRPATLEELQGENGWVPLTKQLPILPEY